MSGGALRELAAILTLEVEGNEKFDKADEKIKGLLGTFKRVGEIAAEVFALKEVKEFVEGQIEAGAQLKVTADRLGTTTDELQAMQLAAGEAGVGAEALTTGLRFLNRNIAEANKGGGDAAALFRKMGISLKDSVTKEARPAGDVLGDLADHLAEIKDPAEKTEIAMKLLGRGGAELIPLLNRGGEAFDEARKSMQELGGGMSSEFVEQAHEAEAANVRLTFAMTGLKSNIALAVLPSVEKLVEWLTHLTAGAVHFAKTTTILQTGLETLALIAGIKLTISLGKLAKAIGLLKPTIGETLAALWEFAVPVIIVGSLYLIFDDLYTLMKGGPSIIGDILDGFFGFGAAAVAVQYVTAAFQDAVEGVELFGNAVLQTVNLIASPLEAVFDYIKGIGKALGDVASGRFGAAAKDVQGGYDEAGGDLSKHYQDTSKAGSDFLFSPSHLAELSRRRQAAEDAYGPDIGDGSVDVGAIDFSGKKPRAHAAHDFTFGAPGPNAHVVHTYPPSGPGGRGGGGITVNQTNKTDVVVHTSSDDPAAVGDAVGQGVATPQQRALNNALNGVQRP